MSDLVTLSCPSCGGKLQITPDIDRFACTYCGHEHIVKRGGGIVSLAPVVEGLRQVQASVDKTTAELAIARLPQEIAVLEEEMRALREAHINTLYPPHKSESYLGRAAALTAPFALILWFAQNRTAAILFILLFVACLIAWAIFFFGRVQGGNKARETRLDAMAAQHSEKSAMLRRNRQLVSG